MRKKEEGTPRISLLYIAFYNELFYRTLKEKRLKFRAIQRDRTILFNIKKGFSFNLSPEYHFYNQ